MDREDLLDRMQNQAPWVAHVPQWPWWDQEPPDLANVPVRIIGYPGERAKRGYMYSGDGTLEDLEKTDQGGHVYGHDVDTSAGQSGSPVFHNGLPVAVHVGFDDFEERNVATGITKPINDWIKYYMWQDD